MATPQQTYSAAILRACEDHLVRVKAARDARVLAVSQVGPRDMRRIAVYAAANQEYDKAVRNSDAQRVKEDAIALAAFQATKATGVQPRPVPSKERTITSVRS
jgi:hypothetical protein